MRKVGALLNGRVLFAGPILCNPIIQARLESGFSVTTLAKRLGVSKQYISRAEHGTYSSLNNGLVKYGASTLKVKPGEFVIMYKKFQNETRAATVRERNPAMLARRGSNAPGSEIFVNWRSGYWHSITAFCNAFCLHPEIVRAYEDGVREEMPAAMRTVLQKFGILDPNWTETLQSPNDEKRKFVLDNMNKDVMSKEKFAEDLRPQNGF